jgi:hypothetical protein
MGMGILYMMGLVAIRRLLTALHPHCGASVAALAMTLTKLGRKRDRVGVTKNNGG